MFVERHWRRNPAEPLQAAAPVHQLRDRPDERPIMGADMKLREAADEREYGLETRNNSRRHVSVVGEGPKDAARGA